MKTQDLARIVFDFLLDHAEEGFTLAEIAEACHLDYNDARKGVRGARVIAADHGWFIPKAVAASEFRYFLTDDADRITDAVVEVGLAASGMDRLKRSHVTALAERQSSLQGEAAVVFGHFLKQQERVDAAREDEERAYLEMMRDLQRMERDKKRGLDRDGGAA